jgi:hypothetical protein
MLLIQDTGEEATLEQVSAYFPLLEGRDIFFGQYHQQISFVDNSLFLVI